MGKIGKQGEIEGLSGKQEETEINRRKHGPEQGEGSARRIFLTIFTVELSILSLEYR